MLWQWERSGLGRLLVVGSKVLSFDSLVRSSVRSFVRSFVRASKELYKKTSSGVSA